VSSPKLTPEDSDISSSLKGSKPFVPEFILFAISIARPSSLLTASGAPNDERLEVDPTVFLFLLDGSRSSSFLRLPWVGSVSLSGKGKTMSSSYSKVRLKGGGRSIGVNFGKEGNCNGNIFASTTLVSRADV
jgi:hypothetical protein